MATIGISLPRLKSHIETLSTYGRNPGGRGITRSCWSPPHEEARAWLLGRMTEAGLETRVDAAGNTFGSLRGEGAAVLTGSHIDTVPEGGPLDGALGVLAGLECLQTIKAAGLDDAPAAGGGGLERRGGPLRQPLRLARLHRQARPGRRSRSSRRWTGSGSWTRWPGPGTTPVGWRRRAAIRGRSHAYVELHIEQGPHLEAARLPIGLVEGIVGIRRNRLTFVGEPDHAGTTPMAWRKDAFLAACEYALKAREHIVRKGSGRSVTNFGRIELSPGVSNIVPAQAVLLQEMRELDPKILARLDRECAALARTITRRRGLKVVVEAMSRTEPARCAPRVMSAVQAACEQLKLRYKRMPSGAGHDAQNLADRDRLRDALHPLARAGAATGPTR